MDIPAPQVDKFKDKEDDPGFLVAKGKFSGENQEERDTKARNHRSKLANAIFMAITNHGYATVRAIGTQAIANAVRAITTSSARCEKKGVKLYWESVFDKGNLGPMRDSSHVKDVTAFLFRIRDFTDSEDK